MQSSRDPSVLRSLALSFGEGLAFSVGMKLTQSATRPARAAEQPDFAPLATRLDQIEQRIRKVEAPRPNAQQFDQKVIHAIVTALETRLQEQSGQVERRLTELETAIAATVQGAVAQHVEQETAALRTQVVAMHREFADAVARIVAEQVAQRAAAIEPAIEAAVAPIRAEISELRARMAETDSTMAEFVSAISLMCRKAAERNAEEAPAAEPEPPAAPLPDLPLPAFAQSKEPRGAWRIPVASSFLFAFAAIGLLLRGVS